MTEINVCRRSATASRRAVPSNGKVLAGDAPLCRLHCLRRLQWARAISDFELLASEDPVAAWRGRLLDASAGLPAVPAYGG
jgi:glutathione S-transferase